MAFQTRGEMPIIIETPDFVFRKIKIAPSDSLKDRGDLNVYVGEIKTGQTWREAEEGKPVTGREGGRAPPRSEPHDREEENTDDFGDIKIKTYCTVQKKKNLINKVINNHFSQSPPGSPHPLRKLPDASISRGLRGCFL